MTHQQEIHAGPLKFGNDNAFQLELQRRVKEYFRITGRRQRDCWQMYLKTAILVASFAVSYVLLVFVAETWWHGLLLAILLASRPGSDRRARPPGQCRAGSPAGSAC